MKNLAFAFLILGCVPLFGCGDSTSSCTTNPCLNGGTCSAEGGTPRCTCAAGYSGATCQTNVDDCASAPCKNGGTCTDDMNGFTCTCLPGFFGNACDNQIDDCKSNPCRNGGTCTDGDKGYTCACAAGYSGRDCQVDVDDCATNPCQNGGLCSDAVNGFVCTCPAGYSGATCGTNTDDCTPSPCLNNGTCTDGVDSFTCSCPTGFSGTLCQVNANDCGVAPCQHGGVCTDGANTYTCACPAGYTGTNCELDTDDCAGSPCQNGGVCTDHVNGYSCACPLGYAGTNCQTNIDECAAAPCINGGTCTDGINGYTCACATGFTGFNCALDIDECLGSPCQNGGTCTNSHGSYACACVAGFTGTNCENDIDECLANPCQNGGACTNTVGSFTCACPPGTSGPTCSNVGHECLEVLGAGLSVGDGLYTIDPDGAGGSAPFTTYCDMTNGGWTLINDQDIAVNGGYLPTATWLAGVATTPPGGGQWGVLDKTGLFKWADGTFHFRMTYGQAETQSLQWKQTGNPLTGTRGTVRDIIGTPGSQAGCAAFAGLAADGGSPAAFDGDANPCWWFAVGAAQAHNGATGTGIPVANNSASGELMTDRLRLWVRGQPRTCKEHLSGGASTSGAYSIDVDRSGPTAPYTVYCDMTTHGGGWTILNSITGADGEEPLVSDTEVLGNDPIANQAYNTSRAKKIALSALSTETMFRRNNGTTLRLDKPLFDGNLATSNTHVHKSATCTSSNNTSAPCVFGYSNFGLVGGGDFGVATPTGSTCAGPVSNGFDHHNTINYNHLNCGCQLHYLYSYSNVVTDSDAGYDVNTALGDWAVTSGCDGNEGGSLVFYTAVR